MWVKVPIALASEREEALTRSLNNKTLVLPRLNRLASLNVSYHCKHLHTHTHTHLTVVRDQLVELN